MTCSAFDTGYTCTGALGGLSICSGICGDSIRVFSEKCDNGKKAGCLNNCNPDPGYTCTGAPGVSSICSTGDEECDNGNRKGCTNCKVDAGYTCKKDLYGRSICSKI